MPLFRKEHQAEFDIIVVGSGIAGLFAALKASEFASVCLVTKGRLADSNTWHAQGGIAAALGDNDSTVQHLHDTLAAGAGLCNEAAVRVLVEEGPRHVRELSALGVPFDMAGENFALAREGAHSRGRVLHAGGDATGRLVLETLQAKVLGTAKITVREQTHVAELLTSADTVCGVRLLSGQILRSKAVILATGGLGQVYSHTTNPPGATGDGVALAWRAGAEIADMEFIQFHPTVFRGRHEEDTFLATEALRGEGAILRNARGERFMPAYHELAELGSRDLVSRAIMEQMKKHPGPVYLDITHRDEEFLRLRFPTVYRLAGQAGYNLAGEWLPVSPAAHYAMGGVWTGLYGETSLRSLYACGEVACTGVHGANRLASNSLLECLVFAARSVRRIEQEGAEGTPSVKTVQELPLLALRPARVASLRYRLRSMMFEEAGILRHREGLEQIEEFVRQHVTLLKGRPSTRELSELQNLLVTAGLIVSAALARQESRGAHYRLDFPQAQEALHSRQSPAASRRGDSFAPLAV
jgi:L-aspartate oxidase